ncbi:MAG: DUF721 domain-containing protein [Verrucomicrobia bacterium]|nr:DUF721 domain-containing protein [Verrucomicrobiota bacterium]
MPVIQAVTFDLAGTILFPHPSVGDVYASCAAKLGVRVEPKILNQNFLTAYSGTKKPRSPEHFWREVVYRTFGADLPNDKAEAVFQECWQAFADENAWRLAAGVKQTITALKFLGLKVAILSNADARMHKVLQGKGLSQVLDGVYLSTEIGFDKPDAKAFHAVAKSLSIPIRSLVHVGDSPQEDGEGARDAGAMGLIVGGRHAPERCLRAEKIWEVPYVLRAVMTDGMRQGKFSRTVQNLLANLRGLPEDRGRSTDRQLKSLDEAVGDALQKWRIDKPVPEDAIVAHWHQLLPSKLAKLCAPLRLKEDGRLMIQCENNVVRSEVRFHEKALLAKIRQLPSCQVVKGLLFTSS